MKQQDIRRNHPGTDDRNDARRRRKVDPDRRQPSPRGSRH
jgi:hypothetical protein